MSETGTTHRQRAALARVEEATRAARLARIAAATALRARARRRRRALRLLCLVTVIAAAVSLGAVGVAGWQQHRAAQAAADYDAAIAAARDGFTTMLAADPTRAEEYVQQVLAVSTGPQHERISGVEGDLAAAVAELPETSVGRISSAGIIGEIADDRAQVLLIAVASSPILVGADPDSDHLAVEVTLWRVDGSWLIAEAVPL